MRRILLLALVVLCLIAPLARAEEAANDAAAASTALLNALSEKVSIIDVENMDIFEEGAWMVGIFRYKAPPHTARLGIVYDMQRDALVTWDDLFTDGAAAEAAILATAEAVSVDNAYSEYNEVSPLPKDNFAVQNGQLTIYYPPKQLSYFSDEAGAFSFYAYELAGLLRDEVPMVQGDPAQAAQAVQEALRTGALPGAMSAFPIGTAMADADAALRVVDVPDLKNDAAVWHVEASQARGTWLLSASGEDQLSSATIAGLQANRIDFSGLCTGLTPQADCLAALGEPERTQAVAEDPYGRLPAGETAIWTGEGRTFALHFVEGVLHSVTLSEGL